MMSSSSAMRTALSIALGLLFLNLCAHGALAAGGHLHTLLMYTCVTKEVANQCNESYTMDQAGIVNRGATANLTTIEEGYTHGIESLFATHDTFFVNGKGMRDDWRERWDADKTVLEPLIRAGKVVGFFVGDELLSGGKTSVQNFTTCLNAIHELIAAHPHLFTWANEGGTGWVSKFKKTGIPRGLDVISIDDYSLSVQQHRDFHENELYPLLGADQATFLVPGAFATRHDLKKSPWCNGDGTFEGCDSFMVDRTEAFLEWALEDQRVVGFAPWHWDSRGVEEVSNYKEVGVVDMPLLRQEYRKIGQLVRE